MSLSMFREAVAASNARLKAGEQAQEVPCPKCHQSRGIALTVIGERTTTAYCSICSFAWLIT